jgi:hypothetical protein
MTLRRCKMCYEVITKQEEVVLLLAGTPSYHHRT